MPAEAIRITEETIMRVQKTLNQKQVKQLYKASIADPKSTGFYLAKDHGAYIGAGILGEGGAVFYFAGCDPQKNDDYHEETAYKFGGDDFGQLFDTERDNALLKKCADEDRKMQFIISETSIEIKSWRVQ